MKIIGSSNELKRYQKVTVPSGDVISSINGCTNYGAAIQVLRPVKKDTDDESSDVNDCTASFKVSFDFDEDEFVTLIGGDLVCENWKEVIRLNPEMTFDLLLAPHHCSWHAVSTEDTHEGTADSKIEEFLEKSKNKSYVVSSSKPILRDGDNPPSYRAKNVYIRHLKAENRFYCTSEYPDSENPGPLKFQFTGQGISVCPSKKIEKNNSSYWQKSYGGF